MKRILLLILLITACTPISQKQIQQAQPPAIVELAPNSSYTIEAQIVEKDINGKTSRMYAYNGQIPGPIIKVKQNSTITAHFKNSLDAPTTVHWHGIRVENKYDGVPDVTQKLVMPGETFDYALNFPDDGIYWYHPHFREDMQQELGLYGNVLVTSEAYTPAKEEILIIDDVRTFEGYIESFLEEAHYVLMGRFGNVMLVNGKTDYVLEAKTGETIRLYLTDSANTRMFNISIDDTPLKIIGSDSGFYEKDFFANSTILAPGERSILEAVFNKPGTYKIWHRNPVRSYELGQIKVTGNETAAKQELQEHQSVKESIDALKPYFDKEPDYEVELTMEMGHMGMGMSMGGEPIEWEDTMEVMNARSTPSTVKWIMKDRKTGKENENMVYEAKVGDVKKIRIFNNPKSMHPMQHPIHLHGQRFLVLNEENKAWKDTVVVPTGETVDILVQFTNPGDWAFHCHIAEHLEAGMMSMFKVLP